MYMYILIKDHTPLCKKEKRKTCTEAVMYKAEQMKILTGKRFVCVCVCSLHRSTGVSWTRTGEGSEPRCGGTSTRTAASRRSRTTRCGAGTSRLTRSWRGCCRTARCGSTTWGSTGGPRCQCTATPTGAGCSATTSTATPASPTPTPAPAPPTPSLLIRSIQMRVSSSVYIDYRIVSQGRVVDQEFACRCSVRSRYLI